MCATDRLKCQDQRMIKFILSIVFENLDVGSVLTLNVKNGNISGTIAGSYDDFAIQTEMKKGRSNVPNRKAGGVKTLTVSGNNGNVDIEFVNG